MKRGTSIGPKLWITAASGANNGRMVSGDFLRWAKGKAAFVVEKRFMTLADVGEVLNISSSQTYALVRSGELPAIQVGGRGQWRVETHVLEEYIARAYEKTAATAREGMHTEHA